ncbi:hypothetical protein PVAND_006266 [Polypedilum vanderplanki]|uniref:Cuticle protein n=1 Tax=Polypedilum vanderplanki TaxID=319348 RepID=A0A9J6C2M5_POLVA|nr:hypothetical protein PVAND_006266 [Polypedilum vanderplanki]
MSHFPSKNLPLKSFPPENFPPKYLLPFRSFIQLLQFELEAQRAKMLRVFFTLFLMMIVVHSLPQGSGGSKSPAGDEKHEPGMPFDFSYAVNDIETSNDFQHKANSDGDITRGEYRVVLPDDHVQVVRYTADWKNGYNAEISYE